MDGVIRKHNAAFRNLLQYSCPKQNMNIAVDRADVAFRPTSYLANRHGPLPAMSLRNAHRLGVSVFQSRSSDANETRAPYFLPRNAADNRRWVSPREATPIVTVFIFVFSACCHS
jgi:hypothetical protein